MKGVDTMKNINNTNANAKANFVDEREAQFYEDLGRLFVKYFTDGISFQKMTFMLNPDMTTTNMKTDEERKPTKGELLKEYGKVGLVVKNASSIAVSEDAVATVNKIATKFDIKAKSGKEGNRKGYLNCPTAAAAIVDRYGDKLVEEAISILIEVEYLNSNHGITRKELELVTRILALHQKRSHAKAKAALIDILKENTIRSILILAKNTKKYVQRTDIDMMVLFVESEISKVDGVRNQLEK